jgi:hypothetical protein
MTACQRRSAISIAMPRRTSPDAMRICAPITRNGKSDPGDNDPPPPPPKMTQGGNDPPNPPTSLSGVARCWHSNAYFSLFSSLPTEQICPTFENLIDIRACATEKRDTARPIGCEGTCFKRLAGLHTPGQAFAHGSIANGIYELAKSRAGGCGGLSLGWLQTFQCLMRDHRPRASTWLSKRHTN